MQSRRFSALCAVAAIAAFSGARLDADEVADGARGAGYEFAKRIITPILNNPSSASFDWESVSVWLSKKIRLDAAAEPTEIVAVQGLVRATNAFNAIVPQKYMVYMTHVDDVYRPIMVMLGDDRIFTSDAGQKLVALINEQENKNRQKAHERMQESLREMEREAKDKNREREDKAEEVRREAAAYESGKRACREAMPRMKWNVSKVARTNIEKHAQQAATKAGYKAEGEERERFISGFCDAFQEAKNRAK